MATLFMMNVPHNCTETELAEWVQSSGIQVKSVCLIPDRVAGVSPQFAYVNVSEDVVVPDAIVKLNGQHIRDRVILVCQARRAAPAA